SISNNNARIELNELPPVPKTRLAQETINKLPATVEWEQSQDAKAYQVRLTEQDKHGRLIQQQQQTANSLQLDGINNGDYELAISTIGHNGFRGPEANSRLSIDIKGIHAELISPADQDVITQLTPKFVWSYPVSQSEETL